MIGHGAAAPARSLVAGAIARSVADTAARRRYDQCDSTCTADCGHCKGLPIPEQRGAER